MPKPMTLDKPCEVCGKNEWWDNRESKKSPKMPDFKCANKECKTDSGYPNGRWLPKGNTKPSAPQGGRLTGDDTTPDERGQNIPSWEALTYTYGRLYKAVYGVICQHVGDKAIDQNAVQAGVATLLIQGEKAHIPLLHPRKPTPEPVAAPPKPKKELPPFVQEEFEEVEDTGLPF